MGGGSVHHSSKETDPGSCTVELLNRGVEKNGTIFGNEGRESDGLINRLSVYCLSGSGVSHELVHSSKSID